MTACSVNHGNRTHRYIRRWETKDLRLGPISHVAEAVGPGFELGHWSFFSCRLSSKQCLRRGYYKHFYLLTKNLNKSVYIVFRLNSVKEWIAKWLVSSPPRQQDTRSRKRRSGMLPSTQENRPRLAEHKTINVCVYILCGRYNNICTIK